MSLLDGILITFDGYGTVSDEVAVAYIISNYKLFSANMIKLSAYNAKYNFALTKPVGDYKLYVLVMNSKDKLIVNEVYVND